jgi:post-segregation antitoxin (ccd killing protein)
MTFVDIDFNAYRRENDNRSVRKNLSLPSWLNDRAEKAGVNFSQVLQEGLKVRLGIKHP